MASPHVDPEETKRQDLLKYDFTRRPLAGRVVLVAGGTGGLGTAVAAMLITEGAFPILGYRSDKGRAELVQQRLQDTYAGPVGLVRGDVCVDAERRRMVEDALRIRNRLDGLVALTGDPSRVKTETLDADGFREALDRNTVSSLLLARDVAAAMRDRSIPGAIVLLSSMQGTYPFENGLAYGVAKAALSHGARVLAKEFGGRAAVVVNVVAPGVTSAGMARASVDSGKYDAMIDRGVITRFGKPDDVARVIRVLIDPDCYVTGQTIVVDGGLTLRRDL